MVGGDALTMSVISIRLDDKAIQAALSRLAAKVADMKPVMERIGQDYEARVLENFAREADPDGNKWAPLSPVTLMLGIHAGHTKTSGFKKRGSLGAKGRNYLQRKKQLIASGNLINSIIHKSSADSVTIGSAGKILYAAIHQFGGMAGRGKKVTIPARPYLALTKGSNKMELAGKDRKMIINIIEEYIDKAVTA